MKTIAVLLFVAAAATVNAQTPKFGHIDLQALIQVMPERTTAEEDYSSFQGELEEILGGMQNDLQVKMDEFQKLGEEASQIKKDAKIAEIAAASILAKVTRDREMIDYEALYPGYGFSRHKGYPTAAHMNALRELGK